MPPRTRATLTGFAAILMWSALAVLTVATFPMPPLQVNAVCFAIGGGIGLVWVAAGGRWARLRQVPLRVYLIGTAGLFGFHLFYFSALRLAPPAEAGLIAYLWPLLIVLFSGLLPGERLRRGHVAGAGIAFCGAGLVVLGGGETALSAQSLPGLALALLCALTWAGYSVISRRMGTVPTEAVTVYCLATALLSALAHLVLETPAWPESTAGWLACIALGAGPVGAAFYLWDIGVKHGNIQMLGVASYAAPLLSTVILVVAGVSKPTFAILIAAALIALGAALAARASAASPVRRD